MHLAADAAHDREAIIHELALIVDVAGLVLGLVAVEHIAVDGGELLDVGRDFGTGIPLGEDLLHGLDDAEAVADDLIGGHVGLETDGDEERAAAAGDRGIGRGIRRAGDDAVEREGGAAGIGIILLEIFAEKSANENLVFHAEHVLFENQIELVLVDRLVVAG